MASNITYTMYSYSKVTKSPELCPSAQNAHAADMAFVLSWSSRKPMPPWTLCNQNAEHSQSGEIYSRMITYHTVSCIWTRYAEHSHQMSAPCSQIDGTAACCSNGGRGTLSEAVGAEMVGRRVQGHANALPGRKGNIICTCHQDPQTYPTCSLANTPPTALYVPGWGWCCTESRTLRGLHVHWRRSHCTDGRQTDYRQFSGRHERVCCSSCSWKPECWIMVGLYDYGQHPTLLHTSANMMAHGISTYIISSVYYHSSSGATMLITPVGVLYTWLRCRFSRQKSSMSSRKATSW